jgi:hypothetical protein
MRSSSGCTPTFNVAEPANAGADPLGQPFEEVVGTEVTLVEVLLHQLFVAARDLLDEPLAQLRDALDQVGRDLPHLVAARAVGRVEQRPVRKQVDDAAERALAADRDCDRRHRRAQVAPDLLEAAVEVRALAVHLVDEDGHRQVAARGAAPQGLGPHLHPVGRAHHADHPVADRQGVGRVTHEVRAARHIDEGQTLAAIIGAGDPRRDRALALQLLRLDVEAGVARVHRPEPRGRLGVEQDGFPERRGAVPTVADQGDVAYVACGIGLHRGNPRTLEVSPTHESRVTYAWRHNPVKGAAPLAGPPASPNDATPAADHRRSPPLADR